MSNKDHGHLFVVGGAEDREGSKVILRRFVEAAGGGEARIVVNGTASSTPEEILATYERAFADLGVRDVHSSWQRRRTDADDPDLLAATERATGVFFTGGDQLKLVANIGGTGFARAIHDRFQSGLPIAGTSAGASALGRVMIGRGHGQRSPRLSTVRLAAGLGIVESIIIDQHFRERDRIGRLITAVIKNPSLLGFGVDEDTAFVLDHGGDVEVVGKGTLTIVDGSALEDSNIADVGDQDPVAFAGITLHALATGWGYNVHDRRVRLPEPAEL